MKIKFYKGDLCCKTRYFRIHKFLFTVQTIWKIYESRNEKCEGYFDSEHVWGAVVKSFNKERVVTKRLHQ